MATRRQNLRKGKKRELEASSRAPYRSKSKRLKKMLPNSEVKTPHSPSRLESLPLELLEYICILGENCFFPVASPILSVRLSTERIYMACCFQELYMNWHSHSGTRQAWLFSRRWMTWDLFKKYVTRAYQTYKQGVLNNGLCYNSPPDFSPKFDKWNTQAETPYLFSITCRIPPKLCHSPFTPDKVAFLRFLTSTRMLASTINCRGYNLAWALKDGIMEGNLDIIALMQTRPMLGIVPITEQHLILAIFKAGCNREIVRQLIEILMRTEGVAPKNKRIWEFASEFNLEGSKWLLDWLWQARNFESQEAASPSRVFPALHTRFLLRDL